MAQVKFAYGTKARYDALAPKDMDTLYFTTDTLQLFKGTTEYTKSTKMVSSLPAAGQVQGIIYFRMTDYTMHIWNGVEFVQLNKTTVTQIPADATNDDIPTTKAVADYVNANWTLLNDNNFSLGTNKSALNGKAKILLDGAKQSSVSIKGTGITTVMTNENGELVVNTGDPSMYMEALTNSDIDKILST